MSGQGRTTSATHNGNVTTIWSCVFSIRSLRTDGSTDGRTDQRTDRHGPSFLWSRDSETNQAGYSATLVVCEWAGAVLEKVTRTSGQELYAQNAQKRRKSKGNRPNDRPTDRQT